MGYLFLASPFVLLFTWLFLKIRNSILIKKLNYKEMYKQLKSEIKKRKKLKCFSKIIIFSIIILVIYFVIGVVSLLLAGLMFVVTLGGIMYVEAGGDSTFFDGLMEFASDYVSSIPYAFCYTLLVIYGILSKGIYFNILVYKNLKNKQSN